jgi:hypothetical protein
MKNILPFVFFSLLGLSMSAQGNLSILFVDDAEETVGNAEAFTSAILAAGYDLDFFDAEGTGQSPNINDMEPYDLVIWHTSNDGTGLWLWGEEGTDNEELMGYLSTGGSLWLVGLDFLFARYGVPPVAFAEGDFMYDYLGVSAYSFQSYGDDGGLGVPTVISDAESPISALNNLTWIFDTLWWVDAVELTDSAQPVYRMGNDDYVFSEEICGAWYTDGNHRALTYFFDLSVVETTEMLNENVATVLGHFESQILSAPGMSLSEEFVVFPNPAVDSFTLDLAGVSGPFDVTLCDLAGREILRWDASGQGAVNAFEIPENLPNGIYLLTVIVGENSLSRRLQIQR